MTTVAVRHNSSQIPAESGTAADPVFEASGPPVSQSSDSTTLISEQVSVEPVSAAASVVDVPLPPPVSVLDSAAEAASAQPTPVLTQPLIEQAVEAAPTAAEVLQVAATEQSLAELGLAGYTPVGLIQNLLEFMHVDIGLPWWGAIVVGTVLARLAVFPVIVKGQREAAKLNNVLPEMTKLTNRMNEAKQSGNKFEFGKAYSDLTLFQKKHDVNPLRGFLVPLVQAPIFISFFIALRKMAYLPVPQRSLGGCSMFHCVPGSEGNVLLVLMLFCKPMFHSGFSRIENQFAAHSYQVYLLFALSLTKCRLLLLSNAPQAVFTYWLTSNCFSLGQVALLRLPFVREKFRIPEKIKHPASSLPQNDGFVQSMKKGWKNAQLAQQLEERERRIKNHLDLAAKGPLRQTFTHNPLQQTKPFATGSAENKAADSKARPWKDTIG
ncbi:unnamed protein product, partial [Tetraodon nigroviridis]